MEIKNCNSAVSDVFRYAIQNNAIILYLMGKLSALFATGTGFQQNAGKTIYDSLFV